MTQKNKDQGGTEWNYNVHAYPKNYSEKKPEKKVVDSGKNVGDEITYTVTAYAQRIRENQRRTVMRIEDTLDNKLTAPSPDDVKVAGFEANTDYQVSVEGQKVTVTFLAPGLKKIENGQKIEVTIPATVREMGDGDVKNKAKVFDNDPNTGDENKPKETPEVHTYYGGVKFTKVEAGTENKLAGAEFKVYGVKQGQTCDKASIDGNKLAQVKVNGKEQTYTSEADTGLVTIDGLHVNDYANATEGTKNLYTSYCLVETKSPKGFELLARPVEFTVSKNDHGKVLNINTTGKIENLKDRTPELPMTGGDGVGILAAIGAAIIGAGAWFARRNSAES
ncbi:isopeptide-forming domain-containing fimbrial protein [Corynebacterium diphtheriae]|nr:isopeptide-forming domain-containing fimbrial protein [Corynebacterium diphtheriae]